MKCQSIALLKSSFPSSTWEGVINYNFLFMNNIGYNLKLISNFVKN